MQQKWDGAITQWYRAGKGTKFAQMFVQIIHTVGFRQTTIIQTEALVYQVGEGDSQLVLRCSVANWV